MSTDAYNTHKKRQNLQVQTQIQTQFQNTAAKGALANELAEWAQAGFSTQKNSDRSKHLLSLSPRLGKLVNVFELGKKKDLDEAKAKQKPRL